MPVDVPILLPPDVVVVPVDQLPSEVRAQFDYRAGEYAVTRPLSRAPSIIVDARTAALLEIFRSPKTVVDAVITLSAAENLDPRETLDSAFPLLTRFLNARILVNADSELASEITASLSAGDRVGAFEVIWPIQILVDTEVYFARSTDGSPIALKLARASGDDQVRATFSHEASLIERLDGRGNPRLRGLGEANGYPFIALSWCQGVDVQTAAADARRLDRAQDPVAITRLVEQTIAAYAHLHRQGVLHGDIHPRNILVDAQGAVTLVDFGLAQPMTTVGDLSGSGRGGIDLFMEPDAAVARSAGAPAPPVSPAGEQYSVAALAYLLLTGSHTHAFSLEETELLRQLVDEPPLPFARHGVSGLPNVEATVARALAKDPLERFGSVDDLLDAFRDAVSKDLGARPPGTRSARPDTGMSLLDDTLARLAVPGRLFADGLSAPTASVMNGAAGLAYALLRVAMIKDDESLLATADLWSIRATLATSPEAFWNQELGITPDVCGEQSFFHTAAGVHCVGAMVAHARGDAMARELALEAFVRRVREPCPHADVAFGKAGLLLGCALLVETLNGDIPADGPLRELGENLARSVWEEYGHQRAVAPTTRPIYLGAAHGWAGILYAVMRWIDVAGVDPPDELGAQLAELASLSMPVGRGLAWPRDVRDAPQFDSLAASWCNGAAGLVHLWTIAHRLLRDDKYAQLAVMAAWTACEGPDAGGALCCGLAGRAYALSALYRHSGEREWLLRARDLAERAVMAIQSTAPRRDSLYNGEIGVALLAAELQSPELARMPLFDAVG
jgi:eukaryotic-like serine/threonine-protein kinase